MKFPITVMYNPKERKIGSVHMQEANDCNIPTLALAKSFSSSKIETKSSKLSKFTISSKQEFDRIVKLTNEP